MRQLSSLSFQIRRHYLIAETSEYSRCADWHLRILKVAEKSVLFICEMARERRRRSQRGRDGAWSRGSSSMASRSLVCGGLASVNGHVAGRTPNFTRRWFVNRPEQNDRSEPTVCVARRLLWVACARVVVDSCVQSHYIALTTDKYESMWDCGNDILAIRLMYERCNVLPKNEEQGFLTTSSVLHYTTQRGP